MTFLEIMVREIVLVSPTILVVEIKDACGGRSTC